MKGKHGSHTAAKSLLSFGEELDEDEGSAFSLAETTRHKYATFIAAVDTFSTCLHSIDDCVVAIQSCQPRTL